MVERSMTVTHDAELAIDTHVHIWSRDTKRYPLANGFSKANFACDHFEPRQILAMADANRVARIVLVQMSYYGFDNSYMLDAIDAHPEKFRGIAVIDDRDSASADMATELIKRGIRGFRIVIEGRGSLWSNEPGIIRMCHRGAKGNFALCVLTNPRELAAVGDLCAQCPETPIIIDHMGRIGMAGPILEDDIRVLCSLSRFPRVMIKISAFYALGMKKPPYLDLEPLIEALYQAYGPDRLMWGSDAPFQTVDGSYEGSISLIRDHLSFLSDLDRQKILYGTANAFFFGANG